jgi:hypothetical protein
MLRRFAPNLLSKQQQGLLAQLSAKLAANTAAGGESAVSPALAEALQKIVTAAVPKKVKAQPKPVAVPKVKKPKKPSVRRPIVFRNLKRSNPGIVAQEKGWPHNLVVVLMSYRMSPDKRQRFVRRWATIGRPPKISPKASCERDVIIQRYIRRYIQRHQKAQEVRVE